MLWSNSASVGSSEVLMAFELPYEMPEKAGRALWKVTCLVGPSDLRTYNNLRCLASPDGRVDAL